MSVAELVAEGDLKPRVEVTSSDETGHRTTALKAFIENLVALVVIVSTVRNGRDGRDR